MLIRGRGCFHSEESQPNRRNPEPVDFLADISPVHYFLCCNTSTLACPNGRAVCCRSPAEIVGSNPTRGMDVCWSVVCSQVEVSATS
jgi:hypothetical protein